MYIGDFTMSKSFQNLLFAFLFLLGHLLSPTMSQLLLGASCPKGKVMVCCYGAPFVCYAWDWPCEDYEVEQCCKRTDNVDVGAFDECQDPIGPETQPEPVRDSPGLKTDPDFNTEFGVDVTPPPPIPEASQSSWTDWLVPILTAPWSAGSHKPFFGDTATP